MTNMQLQRGAPRIAGIGIRQSGNAACILLFCWSRRSRPDSQGARRSLPRRSIIGRDHVAAGPAHLGHAVTSQGGGMIGQGPLEGRSQRAIAYRRGRAASEHQRRDHQQTSPHLSSFP